MLANKSAAATITVKDVATAATWMVGTDVDAIARELRASASSTTTCLTRPGRGGVHVSGDIRVAWFKDPDGNILSIVNG